MIGARPVDLVAAAPAEKVSSTNNDANLCAKCNTLLDALADCTNNIVIDTEAFVSRERLTAQL